MKKLRKIVIILLSLGMIMTMLFLLYQDIQWLQQWNYVEVPKAAEQPDAALTDLSSGILSSLPAFLSF